MNSQWRVLPFLLLLCAGRLAVGQATTAMTPSLVLEGDVRPTQNQRYIEAPFTVPSGTHRITVTFHNLGHDQHTVIDLGIADPFRFRGASGGNKDHFTLSETDATPSYLPGAIPAGRWKLLLAVPNIRKGITSHWRAEIWFNRTADDSSFAENPLRDEARWYRGDLHMHTAHSDGSCPSQSGKPVPCPVFLTLEAAVRRGLDFIAVTDHNTTSHYDAERELQGYFDKLLLIPGRELTTFHGHANAFGTTRFIDYRVGSAEVPDVNAMLRGAQRAGAIVSINHPEDPSGEICMGCGWTPTTPVDMDLVTSVEVVNGGGRPATRFWDEQLKQGYRITGIGGSDNHHADWPVDKVGSIGYPTTVVYAHDLSAPSILDGIRAGRVFVDVTGSRDRLLEVSARAGSQSAVMGGDLEPQQGEAVSFDVHVAGCEGAKVRFVLDGEASTLLPDLEIKSGDETVHSEWKADSGRHFIRIEVRDGSGRLLLLGNPVYIGFHSGRR